MRKIKVNLIIGCFCLVGLSAHSQGDTMTIDSSILDPLDHLMNSWYAKKAAYHNNSQVPFEDGGYENASEDSLYMHRLELLTNQTFFPMVYNDEIRAYIRMYIRKAKQVSVMLGLAKNYFPLFEELLDKYGCPLELKYLAVIESALNPVAVSRAGATGLWQFMYNTGKLYGLEVTTLVDNRRDPFLSTDAAARHLKDLSDLFQGDWVLAIAAYNCGQGNVKKAIVRSGGKTNFWEIYNYLPKETRGYVPAFYGAWYVMQYYDKYGIVPAAMQFALTDTVHIDKSIHFQQIAAVLNLPIEEIRLLNPQYKRDIIAGSTSAAVLNLPIGYVLLFERLKDSIYSYNNNLYFASQMINFEPASTSNLTSTSTKTTSSTASGDYKLTPKKHTVKSGESLNIIAKKYRTSVTEIAKLNKIRTTATIHPGQQLIVGYTKTPTHQTK
jgi:membrane-bound lytic murein transglycosylase D